MKSRPFLEKWSQLESSEIMSDDNLVKVDNFISKLVANNPYSFAEKPLSGQELVRAQKLNISKIKRKLKSKVRDDVAPKVNHNSTSCDLPRNHSNKASFEQA